MCVIFHEELRKTEAKARRVHRGREDQGAASVTSMCLQYKQLCVRTQAHACMKTRRLCLVEKKKHQSFSTVSAETKNVVHCRETRADSSMFYAGSCIACLKMLSSFNPRIKSPPLMRNHDLLVTSSQQLDLV